MARPTVHELPIERLADTETRLGVALSGMYATWKGPDSDGEYSVSVTGEITGGTGPEAERIEVVGALYDPKDRVVGTMTSYINSFAGFDTFDLSGYVRVQPKRVRVYLREG